MNFALHRHFYMLLPGNTVYGQQIGITIFRLTFIEKHYLFLLLQHLHSFLCILYTIKYVSTKI